MKLQLNADFCRALIEAKINHKAFSDRENYHSYVTIDPLEFKGKDREIFLKVLTSDKFQKGHGSAEFKTMLRVVNAVYDVENSGHAGVRLKNLETLAPAITSRMNDTPRRWLFTKDDEYGQLVPYFFTSAVYHPPRRQRGYYSSAYVKAKFVATSRGHKVDFDMTFYRHHLAGHPSLDDLFAEENAFFATEQHLADFQKQLDDYKAWAPNAGKQFMAGGVGIPADDTDMEDDDDHNRRWYRRWYGRGENQVQMVVDGQEAKVVMDDAIEQGEDNNTVAYAISQDSDASEYEEDDDDWDEYDDPDDDEDETPEQRRKRLAAEQKSKEFELSDAPSEKEKMIVRKLPTHPVVRVFNLRTHSFVTIHVADLTEYPYDKTMGSKLVLPEDHKQLIDALTDSAITRYGDIISGKATGVIILCSGTPGTGKTLTAEVYSEIAERPLYSVQCSQLGTDVEELEKKLSVVLKRAVRWNAILLIDEADVYIHERGSDMKQNAVVGVFLMALEYYQGILFMTTNRGGFVDDAIISRMTAHIKYEVPAGESRNRIWHILAKQYDVEMSEEMVKKAVQQFPKVSGRTIRQMLKLAKFMAEKTHGGRVTLESLRHAAKFHNFTKDEEMSKEEISDVQVHR